METLPAPDEILIGTLNVRALRGKIDDIIALVEHHSLDILCITETHLHKNVDNSEISIDNFTLVRRDRNCHGGGVAIYAHQSLSAQPLPLTEREPSPDSQIESVWVEIKRQGEPLLIGCILRQDPPPPLEAILVIFGPRALIFFLFESSWKKMKNDATFVRMCSGDHLGDAKMSKKGTSLRRI